MSNQTLTIALLQNSFVQKIIKFSFLGFFYQEEDIFQAWWILYMLWLLVLLNDLLKWHTNMAHDSILFLLWILSSFYSKTEAKNSNKYLDASLIKLLTQENVLPSILKAFLPSIRLPNCLQKPGSTS